MSFFSQSIERRIVSYIIIFNHHRLLEKYCFCGQTHFLVLFIFQKKKKLLIGTIFKKKKNYLQYDLRPWLIQPHFIVSFCFKTLSQKKLQTLVRAILAIAIICCNVTMMEDDLSNKPILIKLSVSIIGRYNNLDKSDYVYYKEIGKYI